MKILHPQSILLMTYVLTTYVDSRNPFLNTAEILHVRKKQNKAVHSHIHKGDIPISDFMFNRFVQFYIESQYQLFETKIACKSYNSSKCHAFETKKTPKELKKVKIRRNYFGTNSFIEDSILKQKDITYHEKIWVMCSFFEHFFFPLKRHFSVSELYDFIVLISLTAFFVIEFILFFKRRRFEIHKANKYKKSEFFHFAFFVFFAHTFQMFDNDTKTFTISNTSEFEEINNYINVTKHVIICCEVESIPGNAFNEWRSLISVNISDSVLYIGNYAFSLCSNLSTLIIGENVIEIGGSAFSSCPSLTSVTIPNSVTSIGNSAFSLCFNLSTLIIGENINEIGGSAFGNCYELKCIYFYGYSEPEFGESAFYNVSTSIITFSSYQSETFGTLYAISGTTIDGCSAMATFTFTESNTFSFSNTFTHSNTLLLSNTFTQSLRSSGTLSLTFALTHSLSVTHTITIYDTQTNSFSLSAIDTSLTYVQTEVVYYEYAVVAYSSYYSFYTNFFTVVYPNEPQTNDSSATIIISVCAAVAAVVIVSLLVVVLIRFVNKKRMSSEQEQEQEQDADNFEGSASEIKSSFTIGMTSTSIEEDPFADDFKEDKFINQI